MLLSRPAPETAAPRRDLGFDSLPALIGFGALLSLLALSPAQLSGFWPASYDFWPQALFLLLSAGAALLLALSPAARVRFDASAWLVVAFLGWSALSVLTSVDKHDSILEMARILGAFVPFFAVRALWKRERAVWIVGAWAVGAAWVCVPALLDFVQTHNPRQFGPYSNNNLFANCLAMTLPVALVLPVLVWRQSKARWLALVSVAPFLLCTLGLISTASKGGFLGALCALILTTTAIWKARNPAIRAVFARNRAVLSLFLLLFVIVFGALAAKAILPRLQQARGAEDNSTMFRAYIWRSTLHMTRDRPLLGFGPGAFPHIYPRYAIVSYTRHAHQSWLQIAAENGLPALFLLLGAAVLALKTGWRRLKSADWPQSAALMGTLAAMLVHGCVDSGFQTLSIALFFATALGILTAFEDENEAAPARSRLDPFWLGATVLLALAGNQTQKAASGEDARAKSVELARNGAPTMGLEKAREATALDPGAARLWSNLGRLQEGAEGDGTSALQIAATLQPTRAANWANLARAAQRSGASPLEIEKFYARAIENDPLDTGLRLERAQFRLDSKNGDGLTDLLQILALWNAPYGKYAPIEQNVNLDFARATVLLAPFLTKNHQTSHLQILIARALADCARARSFQAQNEAMRAAMGGEIGGDDNADLENIAAQLRGLQTGSP